MSEVYPVYVYAQVWAAMVLTNIWFYIGYKLYERSKKREVKG